jgi:hypothetical protein
VRTLVVAVASAALAGPALGQSRELSGHAGVLGEWQLSATVTEAPASSRPKEFSGALKLKHVGICTQDGPEEKTGEIRFQLSGTASRMKARLLIDGVSCDYSGKLSDSYSGTMTCPDRRPVPVVIWLK